MAALEILKKLYEFALDIIFPIYCLGCGEEGEWICRRCIEKIELLKKQACPLCGEENSTGARCFNCCEKTALDGVIVAAAYFGKDKKESLIKNAIHVFKYRFAKDLAEPLSELAIRQLKGRGIMRREKAIVFGPEIMDKVIVPVPLHSRRFRWRGFNQAELLADKIAKHFDLPLINSALIRQKNNIPQADIKERMERINNIRGAFICTEPDKIKNKTVVLVDDVATTSATLGECAKALKMSGAKEVWGVVVARG